MDGLIVFQNIFAKLHLISANKGSLYLIDDILSSFLEDIIL